MRQSADDRGRYLQVADALRARIAAGDVQPGTALPSESQLCAEFGIARGTARKALATLESEGLVQARQGSQRVLLGGVTDRLSTHEDVSASIRQAIRQGRLRPGERLPGESVLAQQHGVSRAVARAALQALQEQGELTLRPGLGRFVKGEDGADEAPMGLRHQHVATAIREAIATGHFCPGQRLPSEYTLAAEHSVSRITVRQALRVLQDEGSIVAKGRRGRFVPEFGGEGS